jgi:flagellin-like protein
MRGVSEVIAIILILMITISLAGLAYMFMSTTMSDVTSSAGSSVDTTTSSMLTSFTIESMDVAKVYVRNTGQSALTSLSVYVNDEPATYNVTTPIAAGAVGTITIYSFIPDGATIKLTTPSGFSTSKVAQPCSKSVGCWKFDEGSGTTAYDSSPYGNTGTLTSGPTWTSGRYGGALRFDGSNDFVSIGNQTSLSASEFTISAWINPSSSSGIKIIASDSFSSQYRWHLFLEGGLAKFNIYNSANVEQFRMGSSTSISAGTWYYIAATYNGTHGKLYVNYMEEISSAGTLRTGGLNQEIGRNKDGNYFNGTIDELRIYNRAIY